MKRVVVDAPTFLEWFSNSRVGRSLRAEYEAGQLLVHVPGTFPLNVLEAARRTGDLDAGQLTQLAEELDRVGFDRREPPAEELASWVARGLAAAHAPYAALAAALDVPLVTTDHELLEKAASVAQRP